jgi:hypothetical protein
MVEIAGTIVAIGLLIFGVLFVLIGLFGDKAGIYGIMTGGAELKDVALKIGGAALVVGMLLYAGIDIVHYGTTGESKIYTFVAVNFDKLLEGKLIGGEIFQ